MRAIRLGLFLFTICFLIAGPALAQTSGGALQAAKQAQAQGKLDEALNHYGKIIANPDTAKDELIQSLIARASLLLAMGKSPDVSLADAERIIELDPKNAKAYWLRGICFRMGGIYLRALADFNKALELEPGLNRVYMFKGLTHLALGEYDKAAAAFDKLNLPQPHYASAFVQLARAFSQIDQNDKALAWADKALKLNPNDPSAIRERAMALQDLGKHGQAMEAYNQALKLTPNEPRLHILKASLFMKQGEYPKADEQLGRAIALIPKDYIPLWWRARVRSLMGQPKQAMTDLQAAIKLSRGNLDLLMERADLMRKLGEFDLARQEYLFCAKTAPGNEDLQFARGLTEFMAGNFAQADEFFKASINEKKGGKDHYALWHFVSQARSGKDARLDLQNVLAGLDKGTWPEPAFRYLLGKISAQEILAFAEMMKGEKGRNALADSHFFIAQQLLAQGKKDEALMHLKDCVALGSSWSETFEASLHELKRMGLAPAGARATLAPVY